MRYIFHLPFSILHSPFSNFHLEVLSRLDGLEKDVSFVKEGQARMRAEFRQEQAQMRAEFREYLGGLRREMHERFDRLNKHFDDMHHQMLVQTRWFIGALALIGTVVSVLLAIAQFTL